MPSTANRKILLFLKRFKAVQLSDIERAAKITRGTLLSFPKWKVLKEGLYSYYALLNSKEPKRLGIFRHCGNHVSTSLFRN